ncbi:MAG TPA: hypothetical protein VKV39_08480 [Candidatus Sulfotelmatobacter sp.]|nr:hypothetical protein [Candidatus Sulfotelmatobacter sp.]
MNRRGFLKSGAMGALAKRHLLGGIAAGSYLLPASAERASLYIPKSSLDRYTPEDHRQRLQNIARCESAIRGCRRKHLVTDYVPGQCTYNLGEYPAKKPWEIGEWDAQELDRLKDEGIGLIQLHEEWNDSQRLLGADKYSPVNPNGFRQFLEMAHQRGMKVIVYLSSGFIERRDPDFRPEWARDQDLVELFYHYALCSPASPSWRAYICKQFVRVMEEYGVDGVYNDLGYAPLAGNSHPPTKDEVLAFPETPQQDGALGDLLALLYEEVKRRGGIVKVHVGDTARPLTDLKVYDYLWVGEGVTSGDSLRMAVRDYTPYVVPCLDMSRAKIGNEDELYLQSIPYLQFPLLLAGKPFTGQRGLVEGIHYVPEAEDFWTHHCHEIWNYYQAHPNGPYSYGWWDSVPGRPEARTVHAKWLRQYAPMVEEGTWAWIEIAETAFVRGRMPNGVVASLFANRETYLVLANYGERSTVVETAQSFANTQDQSQQLGMKWELNPRSLLILKLASAN